MSNLNSLFDVIRGWPNECALPYEFKQKAGVSPNIAEGTVVAVEVGATPGKPVVNRYTSAPGTGGNLDHPWLVIEGCDQYDGQFTGTLSCLKLRTGLIFRVPTVLTMAVGQLVWAATGVITNVDPGSGAPHLGKVIEVDSTNGWVVIES